MNQALLINNTYDDRFADELSNEEEAVWEGGEGGFLLTNSNLFFYRFKNRDLAHTHTQHEARMLMSLAFLKLLLSSWHCTLA